MQDTAVIRSFNRFYTQKLGLLARTYQGSPFSLTAARVLFELAAQDGLLASELCEMLDLDRGYLSRLLADLERRELIVRTPDAVDSRKRLIGLTAEGRAVFAALNRTAADQAERLLGPLTDEERAELSASLARVQRLLSGPSEAVSPIRLRDLKVGDIGWITHRQGALYSEEYGWDRTYEALVARILAEFVETERKGARQRSWIADYGGRVVGSVFLVEAAPRIGKLRLLYVEPYIRGQGLGTRLVTECVEAARAMGCERMTLWTQSLLLPARAIYEKVGFQIVEETPHRSFGRDLVGETWEMEL